MTATLLRGLLLSVLLTLPVARSGVPTKRPGDKELAAKLYRENCWSCHGRRALGNGPLGAVTQAPALAGVISPSQRAEAVEVIAVGRGSMPGYLGVFDRQDAVRIVDWLMLLDPETGQLPGQAEKAAAADKEGDDEEGEDEEADLSAEEAPSEEGAATEAPSEEGEQPAGDEAALEPGGPEEEAAGEAPAKTPDPTGRAARSAQQ